MRVLLVSLYELGHQPLHVASPAAALSLRGHEVIAVDLAVEPFRPEVLDSVDAVGVSVPMHTAMRLASDLVDRIRQESPSLPVAVYGLYADMNPDLEVEARFVGEYEASFTEWIDAGATPQQTVVDVDRKRFAVPQRSVLPDLDRYAHLSIDGEHRRVGYVEASHGCRHRCRHCPIPVVYDGRYRVVGGETVIADALAQFEAGARHITFGDPDFFNGPAYAMSVLEDLHRQAPGISFDVTIKVEHLLRHSSLVRRLPGLGVLYAVSAFESTDDRTLEVLDKGHTLADMESAVDLCRQIGLDIRPSWMPFVPWTTPSDVVDIFRFLDRNQLLTATDPVQMSIKLLIPPGSLMLSVPAVRAAVSDLDTAALTHSWVYAHPDADALQRRLARLAEDATAGGGEAIETMVEMWAASLEAADADVSEAQIPAGATSGRPRMTESWFC